MCACSLDCSDWGLRLSLRMCWEAWGTFLYWIRRRGGGGTTVRCMLHDGFLYGWEGWGSFYIRQDRDIWPKQKGGFLLEGRLQWSVPAQCPFSVLKWKGTIHCSTKSFVQDVKSCKEYPTIEEEKIVFVSRCEGPTIKSHPGHPCEPHHSGHPGGPWSPG